MLYQGSERVVFDVAIATFAKLSHATFAKLSHATFLFNRFLKSAVLHST